MTGDLSIVDLDVGVFRLRSALEVPLEDRKVKWGRRGCINSRFVHKNIWKSRPEKARVEQEIIPLLRETKEAVITLCFEYCKENKKKKLVEYARNIALRIANLEENYLNDKPSDFAPDDRLVKEEKKVWAQVAAGRK